MDLASLGYTVSTGCSNFYRDEVEIGSLLLGSVNGTWFSLNLVRRYIEMKRLVLL